MGTIPEMPPDTELPSFQSLIWPTLTAVKALGGSGSIAEIEAKVTELIGATESQQAVLHKQGPLSQINYLVAWCRTYLKYGGYLVNTVRGVWSVTETGRTATEADMVTLRLKYREASRARRAARQAGKATTDAVGHDDSEEGEDEAAPTWREELLSHLLDLSPDRFEQLAKRLLREAGFTQVQVTGRPGDEGIDGTGIYRPTLVSFPVFFQCKRYRGTVGSSKVRDFRGAMAGRGDQGILITTGTFTAEARAEASRAGAPLIDLIDGNDLCSLLKQYQLGVTTTERIVEEVVVVAEFFDGI
jgi:restriction system protein